MKLSKIDLSNILAVGHSNGQLGLLIDRDSEIEFIEIAAPEAALHGLQMVDFIANTDSTDSAELTAGIESTEIPSSDESITMIPVSSAMAKSIGYSEETETLQIEFSSGAVYQYSDVEPEIWESLQDADSTGSFFNSEIKGGYSSRRLDGQL